LVRPPRGGKPARRYKIDWDAIVTRGDATANLQIFPGDRLVIGRDAVVKATVQINRQSEPFSLILSQIVSYANAMRQLGSINTPVTAGATVLPAEQREALLKELLDYWVKATGPDGPRGDEKALREDLMRALEKARPTAEGPRAKPEK
jgi:hypothetical protein